MLNIITLKNVFVSFVSEHAHHRTALRQPVFHSSKTSHLSKFARLRTVGAPLQLPHNPNLRLVRIPCQRLPIKPILRFRPPNLLPLECFHPTLLSQILKDEPHLLDYRHDLIETELHKRPRPVQQRPQINPPPARREQTMDGVEVAHQIARGVNEEVRKYDVKMAFLARESGVEVALDEQNGWVGGCVGECNGA